jgi:hypothetical protein
MVVTSTARLVALSLGLFTLSCVTPRMEVARTHPASPEAPEGSVATTTSTSVAPHATSGHAGHHGGGH